MFLVRTRFKSLISADNFGAKASLLMLERVMPIGRELERANWGYWLVPTGSHGQATQALYDWLLEQN